MSTLRVLDCDDIFRMQEIGKTIRQQVGKMTLMACGAREWKFLEDDKFRGGLRFRVNAGVKRQYMTIGLTYGDDYTVCLYRAGKNGDVLLEQAKHVYCDQISEVVYRMVNK